jgi:hypothetical protein
VDRRILHTQPLIRSEMSEMVRTTALPCPCGRPFRLHLTSDQANRPVACGLQRWREFVDKPTDHADLGPDHHNLGHRPVPEHDREGRQDMIHPEGMEAELRSGRVEVVQAKSTDTAGSAACPQRVDDHHLAAILEVTDRIEARDSGIEHLHLAG